MPAAYTTYAKNKLCDTQTGDALPFDLYVGLGIDDGGVSEIVGYPRASAEGKFGEAVDGVRALEADIDFPVATEPHGTPTHAAFFDGASGEQVTEWEPVTMGEIVAGSYATIPAAGVEGYFMTLSIL